MFSLSNEFFSPSSSSSSSNATAENSLVFMNRNLRPKELLYKAKVLSDSLRKRRNTRTHKIFAVKWDYYLFMIWMTNLKICSSIYFNKKKSMRISLLFLSLSLSLADFLNFNVFIVSQIDLCQRFSAPKKFVKFYIMKFYLHKWNVFLLVDSSLNNTAPLIYSVCSWEKVWNWLWFQWFSFIHDGSDR